MNLRTENLSPPPNPQPFYCEACLRPYSARLLVWVMPLEDELWSSPSTKAAHDAVSLKQQANPGHLHADLRVPGDELHSHICRNLQPPRLMGANYITGNYSVDLTSS